MLFQFIVCRFTNVQKQLKVMFQLSNYVWRWNSSLVRFVRKLLINNVQRLLSRTYITLLYNIVLYVARYNHWTTTRIRVKNWNVTLYPGMYKFISCYVQVYILVCTSSVSKFIKREHLRFYFTLSWFGDEWRKKLVVWFYSAWSRGTSEASPSS